METIHDFCAKTLMTKEVAFNTHSSNTLLKNMNMHLVADFVHSNSVVVHSAN